MRRPLILGLLVIAVGCLGVGCANGTTGTVGTTAPSTAGVPTSEPTTTSRQQREVADWAERLAGHTISYQMELSAQCGAAGSWSVVERNGTVVQAKHLGGGVPDDVRPCLLLSEALDAAGRANGSVVVSDQSATSIRLDVDVDVDAVDDEFGFYAWDVTIKD